MSQTLTNIDKHTGVVTTIDKSSLAVFLVTDDETFILWDYEDKYLIIKGVDALTNINKS